MFDQIVYGAGILFLGYLAVIAFLLVAWVAVALTGIALYYAQRVSRSVREDRRIGESLANHP